MQRHSAGIQRHSARIQRRRTARMQQFCWNTAAPSTRIQRPSQLECSGHSRNTTARPAGIQRLVRSCHSRPFVLSWLARRLQLMVPIRYMLLLINSFSVRSDASEYKFYVRACRATAISGHTLRLQKSSIIHQPSPRYGHR